MDSIPFDVFISYSHKDRTLRDKLGTALSTLKNENLIRDWYDGDIPPGSEWKKQIVTHLDQDQIILLLISPDFMASKFCYSIEMQQAIARHDNNQARVIPIILRPTD
jgi:TIR domain-containing protein